MEKKEFKALKDKIGIGNYIRVEVDGELKKLKLISIEFDFENIEKDKDCFNGYDYMFSCFGTTRKDAGGAVISFSDYLFIGTIHAY